ncbi:MAG: alkaline phosphatase D family protein [Pirellulaceae bacterium]
MNCNIIFPLHVLILCLCGVVAGQTTQPVVRDVTEVQGLPTRIAFGSCGHQDKPQPVLDTVVLKQPDLFIYLGDNIYGDTLDMAVLQEKYDRLGGKTEFQNLRREVAVLSVWDDHDYGWNDAGKEYRFKQESKEIFMDFWRVPADSPRRQHEGIYGTHRFESDGRVLQVILLDTRTFRDPLKRNGSDIPESSGFKNDYQPDDDPEKTLLGDEQWRWLETQLREPADVRIICSSIQFGHEYNGWESWTNLPRQQQKMVDLIRDSSASGVLFISGDVHWAEISRREFDNLYPLYDVTASGLTEEWYNVEPNQFRMGEAFRDNHFGMIEIDWSQTEPAVSLQIIDVAGEVRVRHDTSLDQLQLPSR